MKAINFIVVISIFISTSTHTQPISWTEFVNGKTVTYKSNGNPKTKGIEIGFDYPASWIGADGKRPNTPYQITSENGRGLENCNLVIKEIPLPAGYSLTPQDIYETFASPGLREFTPDGANFISGSKTTIDGQPAAWLVFTKNIDRAGIQFEIIMISYFIYFNKRIISFIDPKL